MCVEDVTFSLAAEAAAAFYSDTVFRGIKRFTKHEVALCAK